MVPPQMERSSPSMRTTRAIWGSSMGAKPKNMGATTSFLVKLVCPVPVLAARERPGTFACFAVPVSAQSFMPSMRAL